MGAGVLPLWLVGGRCQREAELRPVLHQKHVHSHGSDGDHENGEDGVVWGRGEVSQKVNVERPTSNVGHQHRMMRSLSSGD